MRLRQDAAGMSLMQESDAGDAPGRGAYKRGAFLSR